MFDKYQLKIITVALHYLYHDYDQFDLEELMYSESELQSEIGLILDKIEANE
tara:strand:+ start:631 stop:786 length:156 start_codon:yes stop_codon:yes gene_type:complete